MPRAWAERRVLSAVRLPAYDVLHPRYSIRNAVVAYRASHSPGNNHLANSGVRLLFAPEDLRSDTFFQPSRLNRVALPRQSDERRAGAAHAVAYGHSTLLPIIVSDYNFQRWVEAGRPH